MTLLAAAMRVVGLDQQLWYDEMVLAVRWMPLGLAEIATTYTSQNQHMLYSLLARIAVEFFGEHNWVLRLPAMLFGVASVPALYFCARVMQGRLVRKIRDGGTAGNAPSLGTAQQAARGENGGEPPHSRREALLAAGLLAVSYHHVWFSQNARGYTGLALWTLVTTYFFVRGWREGGLRPWLWYGVTLALGMYTHLTMGFVAAGQFAVLLWMYVSGWRAWRADPREAKWIMFSLTPVLGFVVAATLTLALYAPVLPDVVARTIGEQAGGASTGAASGGAATGAAGAATPVQSEWTNPVWLLLETARGLAAGAGALGYVVLPVGAIILLTGLVSYWKQDRFVVGLMVIPGVITAAVMLLLGHNLWPRFFLFAIGFGMMLLVRGAMVAAAFALQKRHIRLQAGDTAQQAARGENGGKPPHSIWGTVVVGVMIVASAWSVRSAWLYPKQDFAGALEFVESQRQAGEPVVLAGLAVFPLREYYQRDWPAVTTREELESARAGAKRVWLLYASPIFVRSRQPPIWNAIQTEFEQVRVFRGTMGDGAVYVCRSVQGREQRR
ncbi:MAG: glycosyltransferase family 39 protein [Candidatus Acidiferrales bacterium]